MSVLSMVIEFIVNSRFTKVFTGTDMKECRRGGVYFTSNIECRKGYEEAEKALKMTIEERLALIVEHKMSDEEEEMEVDEFDGMCLKNVL